MGNICMKWNRESLFGSDYYIEIKNDERKYFGLDEISPDWEKSEFFSKTNICYDRTVVYWDNDTIKKVITEEVRMNSENVILCRYYSEYDTVIKTEGREMIYPLTSRGKMKKVTASNILNITPFGCLFYFNLDLRSEKPRASMGAFNPRNNQYLAVGEEEKICGILTPEDFRKFIEEYTQTCPKDYFDRVNRMRTEKHKTIKYRPGDIFRVEVDRFRYCYGIITGEILKIQKWPELPERHSLRALMTVPLMIRFFELVTTDGNLKAEDLKNIPLDRVQICSDNDIIWGTHPIVDHKELDCDDIEFNLICAKFLSESRICTVFTHDNLIKDNLIAMPEEFKIHAEWGTAKTILPYEQISDKLKELLAGYHSPHGGVSTRIHPSVLLLSEDKKSEYYNYKYNLLNKHNQHIKDELFTCLGLSKNSGFDDFAEKFGGLNKAEILKKIVKRQSNK